MRPPGPRLPATWRGSALRDANRCELGLHLAGREVRNYEEKGRAVLAGTRDTSAGLLHARLDVYYYEVFRYGTTIAWLIGLKHRAGATGPA